MFSRLYSLADSLRSHLAVARAKFHLKRVGLRQYVRFGREGWKPKVILDERYEEFVVWGSRIVTLLGIVSSLLLIPPPFSIVITVVLAALDFFFERVVLMVRSLFVQPLPKKWDSGSWQGNLYYIDSGTWGIGLIFDSEEMASVALDTVRAWNYGEDIDRDGNVVMTFVELNDGRFMTYLYPSSQRQSLKEAAEMVERKQIEQRKIREHSQNILQMVIAQDFDNSPDSMFRQFKQQYNGGEVILNTFTADQIKDRGTTQGRPDGLQESQSPEPVLLSNVNILHEDDLDPNSVEYQHLKYAMPLIEA